MQNIRNDIKKAIRMGMIKLGYYSKPDFMIIGAQKAGTTALYDILNKHNFIKGTRKKELHYFDNNSLYNRMLLEQYHCFFDPPHTIRKGTKLFEATPSYLYHEEVAVRLHKYNPNLKLIIILRNPTKRAFSAWTMYHHNFNNEMMKWIYDSRSFDEVIQDELTRIETTNFSNDLRSYIKRGIYLPQIERYLLLFPASNVLILESEQLKRSHNDQMKKVQKFLGVPFESLPVIKSNYGQKNEMDSYGSTLNKLQEFYKPHNQALYQFLGEEFNWDNDF